MYTEDETPHNSQSPEEKKMVKEQPAFFSVIRSVQTILSAALLAASLFTLWTPANLFSGQIVNSMLFAIEEPETTVLETASTPMQSNIRIGIVAGHWKDTQNSGFMCSDGLSENTLNLRIATLVVQGLIDRGYQVDLLTENDARLAQYKALALVSIHNDTCEFLGNESTGFKVAPALANAFPDQTNRLSQCLIDSYKASTGLPFQTNKVTTDMTTYHSFNEVHSSTPVVIIETGYLNLDRQILTQSTDVVVEGVIEGILCYFGNDLPAPEATSAP